MLTATEYFTKPIESISDAEEGEFFSGLRSANKTYKITCRNRMSDLDTITIRRFQEIGSNAPKVLDIGVSSGVTTVELLDAMIAHGLRPQIVATDHTLNAKIISLAPGVRVFIDDYGNTLQYDFFGVPIRGWRRRLDDFTGISILLKAGEFLARRETRFLFKNLELISRRLRFDPNILEFVEDDLLKKNENFERKFGIIRAANILNKAYFSDHEIQKMIKNIMSYVSGVNALVIVNRTHENGANNGTIFITESSGKLKIVERIGSGSEVEQLFLDYPFDPR